MRDPEKEVERSRASRAPTHNEYVELPASPNPHITNHTAMKNKPKQYPQNISKFTTA